MSVPLTKSWRLLESGAEKAAYNMALDAALLQTAAQRAQPVLRFYGWAEPAASFGYFQKIADIERATPLRPLVRRPTGGGLVPHDADWTYSVILPPNSPWYQLSAVGSYQRIHEWIRLAFRELGVETTLAECCHAVLPGQCFASHEKFDVLCDGRKIAGAAQRRNLQGLLIQGSVQPPTSALSRADWESAMKISAQRTARVTWETMTPDVELTGLARTLAETKFSKMDFIRRR